MTPFFVAGVIVFFGINAGANAMMDSDEFRNDPRKKLTSSTSGTWKMTVG